MSKSTKNIVLKENRVKKILVLKNQKNVLKFCC